MDADQVRAVEFHQRLRGYHVADVDALLAQIAQALEAGGPVQPLIAAATLRKTLRGYDTEEVDRFLAESFGS